MTQYLTDYPRYAWQVLIGKRSRMEYECADRRRHDLTPYLDLDRPLCVLDLANGRLRPQYTLLKAAGHRVYGIDLVNRPSQDATDVSYVLARWFYAHNLGIAVEPASKRTLIHGNVGVLPFGSDQFDLVTSVAAFEHFLDVPSVVAELARVLRPGGIAWVLIHPFACLSGGHNLSFAEVPLHHVPADVEPWDHLRQRKLPFHVPLNEWRRDQYLKTFDCYFDLLKHYCAGREGEAFLTPEIETELADYSRDELTCHAYIIVARKP